MVLLPGIHQWAEDKCQILQAFQESFYYKVMRNVSDYQFNKTWNSALLARRGQICEQHPSR